MKHVGLILGILVIAVLFRCFVIAEVLFLDAFPPQLRNNFPIEQWIASFEIWALVCVLSAGVASLLWYVLAQFTFKIRNEGKGAGKRDVWVLLFLLLIVVGIVSCFCVEKAESILWIAYLTFFFNGLIPYYLATLLFSPSSFKYTPWGAKQIRSKTPW